MNFRAIAGAEGRHTRWMIVEVDEYEKDTLDGARKSYALLTHNGCAHGKT